MRISRNVRNVVVVQALLSGVLMLSNIQAAGQRAAYQAAEVPLAKPEAVGFSSERLERLHALMQQAVDKKQLPGIVTLLARHGKVVDFRAYGLSDAASQRPMTKDNIFRLHSITKPMTGVAMMILYEQGKWLPSDPIYKFIPEFRHLKVLKGMDPDGKMILVEPEHAPTMGELMTHMAGFKYHAFDVRKQSQTLQEMVDKIAKLPLAYQPGKEWVYTYSMDIQGYIIEKLSGKSMPDFMHDQIFAPLGMKDTGFYVPAEKRNRFATLYQSNDHDTFDIYQDPNKLETYETQPTMPSGNGGVLSTPEDYFRFAQMLLNHGELNGTRILSPSTVQLMMTNHVPMNMLTGEFKVGRMTLRPGFGYAYNGAVAFDPQAADLPEGKGTYFWDGAAGCWFWIDPTNDVVFVGMIQKMGASDELVSAMLEKSADSTTANPNLEFLSRAVVYQALVDPAK